MATSAINRKECYFCKSQKDLECHHLFPGKNRQNAEEDGLKIWLCHYHHTVGDSAVHNSKGVMLFCKRLGQRFYEETHSREEFIERYGRNYL